MIASRGSLEPAGAGLIGLVANNVSDKISGSVVVPLEYPATISNYSTSEAAGVEALTDLLTSYIALCPSAKIALLGYSQVRFCARLDWTGLHHVCHLWIDSH